MKQLFLCLLLGIFPCLHAVNNLRYPVSVVWEWASVVLCNLHFLILR